MTSLLQLTPIIVAFGLLLFAALHDIGFRTIPDWVSAFLVLEGCALQLRQHHLAGALTCGLAVFLLALLCWHRGWLGGGDVKLLGATVFLLPPERVPGFILAVALAGGLLAAIYLLLERIVPSPRLRSHTSFLRRVFAVECRRITRRSSLPYATAISAAAILTLVER